MESEQRPGTLRDKAMSLPHSRTLSLLSALSYLNLRGNSSANIEVPKPKTPNPQPFPSIVHSKDGLQAVHDQGTGDQTEEVAQNNQVTRPTKRQVQQFLLETRIRRQEQQQRGRRRSQREILQSKMRNARTLAENNQETLLQFIDESIDTGEP